MVFVHHSRNEVSIRHRFCSVEMTPAIVAVMLVVNALPGQVIVDVKSEAYASREINVLPWRVNVLIARVTIFAVFQRNVLSAVLIQTKMESVKVLSRMVSTILPVLVVL